MIIGESSDTIFSRINFNILCMFYAQCDNIGSMYKLAVKVIDDVNNACAGDHLHSHGSYLPRSNSRQLSHLARALANFRLICFTIIKDAVPILRINFYRISLFHSSMHFQCRH
jgi:hypothetical protein